jgi:hypothetical protein
MYIYGVDFSGAKDASERIYIAQGQLTDDGVFTLENCWSCDDRLDLYAAILANDKNAIWGLDFPFAPAFPAYERMGFSQWEHWLQLANRSTRSMFSSHLASTFLPHEGRCHSSNWACRHTDVACHAASPFKQVQPNMRSMVYAGWKLLHYAQNAGCSIYPWNYKANVPILCEVYPSHTARLATGKRALEIHTVAQLTTLYGGFRKLTISDDLCIPPTQDAVDACIACLTLAAVYVRDRVALEQGNQPSFSSKLEWENRQYEGLIVRLANSVLNDSVNHQSQTYGH